MKQKKKNYPEIYIEFFKNLNQTLHPDGLRVWQETFLRLYTRLSNETDIVGLRSPTGTGKTLAGLILAGKTLEEGKSVLYLSWTDALGTKVASIAKSIGIEANYFGGRIYNNQTAERNRSNLISKYHRRRDSIGVTNYHAFLLSDIPSPQFLIIDDADIFLEVLMDIFSIILPKRIYSELFQKIYNLLPEQLYPNLNELREKTINKFHGTLVYFSEQKEVIDEIKNSIDESIRKEIISRNSKDIQLKKLYFNYNRTKDSLLGYLISLFRDKIVINPHLPPSTRIKKFTSVDRILLMSATLGNFHRMAWELGIPTNNIEVISEDNFIENKVNIRDLYLGSRAIFPITDIDVSDSSNSSQAILELLDNFNKILILTRSKEERTEIKSFLEKKIPSIPLIIYKNIIDIERFKTESNAVILVAGQYFGLDFPEDICKCAVITQLPFSLDARDSLEELTLENNEYAYERLSRKITQGLGRLNRTEKDQSIFFIFDRRFSEELSKGDSWSKYVPTIILADAMFGFEKSEDGTFVKSLEAANKFINLEYDNYWDFRKTWAKKFLEYRKELDPGYYSGFPDEIEGWNSLSTGAFMEAGESFEESSLKIQRNTINHQDKSVSSRKAFSLYLAAKAYYLLIKLGSKDESLVDTYLDLAKRSQASSNIPFFQRLDRIPSLEINITNISEEKSQSSQKLDDPETFFTSVIWDHEAFNETLKSNYVEAFKTVEIGANSTAGERIHTLIERVLRELIIYYDFDSLEGEDFSKLAISDLLQVIRRNYAVTQKSLNAWMDEEQSPGKLRNQIVHQNYDTDNFQKLLEAIFEVKKRMLSLFSDIRSWEFLDTNLTSLKLQNLDSLGRSFRRLSLEEKKIRILEMWYSESLILRDIMKEKDDTILSLTIMIQVKGGKELQIVLP